MTWLILGLLSAVFTSMTTILAKIGIKDVKSNFATFYRTGVVIVGSVILCFISKSILSIRFARLEKLAISCFIRTCNGVQLALLLSRVETRRRKQSCAYRQIELYFDEHSICHILF